MVEFRSSGYTRKKNELEIDVDFSYLVFYWTHCKSGNNNKTMEEVRRFMCTQMCLGFPSRINFIKCANRTNEDTI